jgi:hypothetical protein
MECRDGALDARRFRLRRRRRVRLVEAARAAGGAVVDVDADHGFTGRLDEVADVVVDAVDRWR